MAFNSISFLIFLPLVFIFYWLSNKSRKIQNLLLLLASYIFYGWWDYRFLLLIAFSSLLDFIVSLLMQGRPKIQRKWLLRISVLTNLGLLGIFKYYNFFISSWIEAWKNLGVSFQLETISIILPVGISFYTFQTLSYTIDVYKKRIPPSKNLIDFSAFVAFFPQLVAGPIERASNLLPQFSNGRIFKKDQAISGIHLIIWGLFKKIVIADSCAIYVNAIFDNYENLNSLTLVLGAIYFSFQIYADFSGYSDIAIGTARLFGFELMQNFNYPYFSRNVGEFWRRWHISLSTWFRDYLYIPLGGSRGTLGKTTRNIFIIFIVSGFWHGANWTFIIWGGLHALFFLPLILQRNNRKYTDIPAEGAFLPSLKEGYNIGKTFCLIAVTWVFFRADSVRGAIAYLKRLFLNFEFEIQYLSMERYSIEMLLILAFFIIFEWLHRTREHPFTGRFKWLKIGLIIFLILTLGVYSNYQEFIYFQF